MDNYVEDLIENDIHFGNFSSFREKRFSRKLIDIVVNIVVVIVIIASLFGDRSFYNDVVNDELAGNGRFEICTLQSDFHICFIFLFSWN